MKRGALIRFDHPLRSKSRWIVGIVKYVCEDTGLTKVWSPNLGIRWVVTSQLKVIG